MNVRVMRKQNLMMLCSIMVFLFMALPLFAQNGTVRGVVNDDQGKPLIGANVFLEGTIMGSSTDADGAYVITDVPEGDYSIVASFISYKTQSKEVSVSAGETETVNFSLGEDVLGMNEVVTTGTVNPKTKIESSVAIATINEAEIRQRAPQNTAELLEAIPGFYVESSGGEGGNNLFARGIPADGSFRYVSLQEDGLPVFEDGELAFGNADLFLRVDETVDRMEAVRGGTGSIFASNAPGGIINFISKTGGNTLGGLVKVTGGDYGLFRTDFNVGGPMGDDWRFNIGGFYRYDEGVRNPGFTANVGGQLKGNITRLMENGFVRLNFKFLNERNIFYLPIPLQNPDEPDEIIGFDPNFGTMTSNNMKFLSVPTPKGDNFEKDLEDGMNPVIKALGGEFNYEFEGGWGVKNVFRFTDIDEEFNAIFSVNNPILAYQHAQNQIDRANAQYPDLGATGFEYRDARTGEVLANTESEADALNGNGLAVTVGWWNVALPMSNFANDLQLSKSFGQHNLTAGFYHTDWKVRSLWYWQDVLADVRGGEEDDEPARVMDLVLTDEEGNTVAYVTRNGISQIGSFYNNYSLDARTNAGYLNDEFTLTDRLTVDGGIRYEVGEITGHVENRQNFDLSPEDEEMPNLADDNVTYGDRSYVTYQYDYDEFAWSIGANFKINEQTAVFGRVSDGFRTPDDQQFFDGGARARAEQNPDDVIEQVFQYEGGVKYSHPNLAVFLSLFGINFQNIPFSDEVIDPQTGNLQTEFRFADSKTIGAEAEANVKFGDFRVGFNGTYQMPEFDNYSFVSQNETEMLEGEDVSGDPVREGGQIVGYRYSFDGLEVRRIPKFFFDIRPSYTYDVFTFYGGYRFFGERFVDDANNVELPAWGAVSAGVSARLGNFTLAVNGHNLTNTIGLTEGNPRVGQVVGVEQDIYMARPILGRSFRGSLTYNF